MAGFTLKSLVFGDLELEPLPSSCKCTTSHAMYAVKRREARKNIFKKPFIYKCLVTGFLLYIWFLNYTMVMSLENI